MRSGHRVATLARCIRRLLQGACQPSEWLAVRAKRGRFLWNVGFVMAWACARCVQGRLSLKPRWIGAGPESWKQLRHWNEHHLDWVRDKSSANASIATANPPF